MSEGISAANLKMLHESYLTTQTNHSTNNRPCFLTPQPVCHSNKPKASSVAQKSCWADALSALTSTPPLSVSAATTVCLNSHSLSEQPLALCLTSYYCLSQQPLSDSTSRFTPGVNIYSLSQQPLALCLNNHSLPEQPLSQRKLRSNSPHQIRDQLFPFLSRTDAVPLQLGSRIARKNEVSDRLPPLISSSSLCSAINTHTVS